MERVLGSIHYNGMSCIGASVEPSTDIVVFGQDVYQLTLALISPLGPKDDAELGVEARHTIPCGVSAKLSGHWSGLEKYFHHF